MHSKPLPVDLTADKNGVLGNALIAAGKTDPGVLPLRIVILFVRIHISLAIGGHGYGAVSDDGSIKAVQKALDLGINFFDTADVYGFGHSEEILGKALGGKRNEVIIATKFGVNWDKNKRTFKDCSPERVVEALEASLRRLKIDCIPLYQMHWHDGVTPIFETMEALLKCKEEGKIKYIGGSNFSFELTKEAMKTGTIDSIQLPYNVINKNWSDEIVHYVSELKLGVIAYQVLARGLLAGKFNKNTQFGPQDTRSFDKDFQGSKFIKNLNIVRKMQKIALKYGKTTSQLDGCLTTQMCLVPLWER